MIWKRASSYGGILGLGAIGAVVGLDVVCFLLFQRLPLSLASFVLALAVAASLPAIVAIAYWVYGFYTLTYSLDRDALSIKWGVTEQIVPLASVREVTMASDVEGEGIRPRLRWAGYQVGPGELPGVGAAQFYATAPRDQQIILVTSDQAFVVTPADRSGFLADLEALRQLDPTAVIKAAVRQPLLFQLSAWSDRVAQAWLAAAVLVNLVLFAYVALRFPGLPSLLPLHFDATGVPDRIGDRIELFRLPIIGLVMLGANNALALVVHRREPLATYLLLAAALAAQLLMAVATYQILH